MYGKLWQCPTLPWYCPLDLPTVVPLTGWNVYTLRGGVRSPRSRIPEVQCTTVYRNILLSDVSWEGQCGHIYYSVSSSYSNDEYNEWRRDPSLWQGFGLRSFVTLLHFVINLTIFSLNIVHGVPVKTHLNHTWILVLPVKVKREMWTTNVAISSKRDVWDLPDFCKTGSSTSVLYNYYVRPTKLKIILTFI